jgi:hypothetical protein
MSLIKTNEMLLNGLYYEWLNNLIAYNQQLEGLESIIGEFEQGVIDFAFRSQLQQIKEGLRAEEHEITVLSDLVLAKREKVAKRKSDNIISFAEVIENNHLRDRVRKAEQTAFYLKYQVNKLLSKAS